MTQVLLAVLAYAAFVLQLSASRQLAFSFGEPNFLMAALLTALVVARGWPAICWAAVLGLLCDLLTPDRLGVWMFASTLVAFGFEQTIGQGRRSPGANLAGFSFFAVLIVCCASRIAETLLAGGSFDTADLTAAAGCTAYSAAIAAGLLICVSAVSRLRPVAGRRGAI